MENGTASGYVKEHPECNVLELVSSYTLHNENETHKEYQIIGIAEGLNYLHTEGVIHSDIKADNVLISNTGLPLICDFGISRMLAASQTLHTTTRLVEMDGD